MYSDRNYGLPPSGPPLAAAVRAFQRSSIFVGDEGVLAVERNALGCSNRRYEGSRLNEPRCKTTPSLTRLESAFSLRAMSLDVRPHRCNPAGIGLSVFSPRLSQPLLGHRLLRPHFTLTPTHPPLPNGPH